MLYSVTQFLTEKLNERIEEGNYRTLRVDEGLIDFTSNDYLGLAHSTKLDILVEKEFASIHAKRNGSSGSRLLSGNSEYIQQVEAEIAAFHNMPDALIFNSGYDANYGLLSCVPKAGDILILDEFIHASIHDGARANKADKAFFKHNDLAHLESILFKSNHRLKYIVVESLYSMDGDFAELKGLVELCEKYSANLIVDEAHATGVVGANGEGLCQYLNLENAVFARIVTFGKAVGAHGAAVLGSDDLIKYLINFCRPFIFSTALPLHSIATIRMSYQFFPSQHELRKQLNENIRYFHQTLKLVHRPISPIQQLTVGSNEGAVALSSKLKEVGIDARPIRYPTVARGQERIRICIHSFNNSAEIDLLCNAIKSNFNHENIH
jgi:8-amino-7-oxononanoate synthase